MDSTDILDILYEALIFAHDSGQINGNEHIAAANWLDRHED